MKNGHSPWWSVVYCTPPCTALENATPALQCNVFIHDTDSFNMSDIHSFQLMGGPPHCLCNFNSQLPMGEGGILYISCPVQSHIMGGGWLGGVLHISHPVKVTSSWGWEMFLFMMWTSFNMSVIHLFLLIGGEGPPHCTGYFNSQLPMEEGGNLHISHPDKRTSMGGWDSPHCTCNFNSQLQMGERVGYSTFHIQTNSHQWEG